ncbi:MAG: hypothetical protein LBE27_07790 [Deltaproteobacteria bacterium]|jgi:hypothetical protein|nr:hypothetical protein [Deltaproteobacteria bacterium]
MKNETAYSLCKRPLGHKNIIPERMGKNNKIALSIHSLEKRGTKFLLTQKGSEKP